MTLVQNRLAAMIAAAEVSMTQATGGQAACVLTRAGVPAPAAKYAEGRWAALRALRSRLLRNGIDPIATVDGLQRQWREDLDARTEAGVGPDWIAYLNGGVDALAEVAGEIPGWQAAEPPDPAAG